MTTKAPAARNYGARNEGGDTYAMGRMLNISLAHYWRTRQTCIKRMAELRERCLAEAGCEPSEYVPNKPERHTDAWHTWIECYVNYSSESRLLLTWRAVLRSLASIRHSARA